MIGKSPVVFQSDVCSKWFYALVAIVGFKQVIRTKDMAPVNIGAQCASQ